MIPADTYLFYEFWVPKRAPYNGSFTIKGVPSVGWPSIVGDFIAPMVLSLERHEYLHLCWFVQEGPHFQVCIATDPGCRLQIEKGVRAHCKKTDFKMKRLLRGDLGGALAGDRWNHPRRFGTASEKARSVLLVETLDRLCRLYIDTLVKRHKGKTHYWVTEQNGSRQNPHHNLFESFHHLVANISEAQFDAIISVRTTWMREPVEPTRVRCHL